MSKESRAKHLAMRLLAALLAVSMLLSGCRQSPALRRISYQSYNQATHLSPDTGEQEKDESAKNGPTNQKSDKTNLKIKDNVNPSQTVDAQATTQITSDGTAVGTQNGASAVTVPAGSGVGSGGGGTGAVTPSSESPSSTSPSSAVPSSSSESSSSAETYDVYLSTEQTVKLPDNVKYIAAVGATAEMVEMLKSSDQKIVATSTAQKNSFFATAFPDIASAAAVWSTDTLSNISDSEMEQLSKLPNKPDVVFCNSISTEKAETLYDKYKIAVVVTPATDANTVENATFAELGGGEYGAATIPFNAIASMKERVSLVGRVLDGHVNSGTAQNLASNFNSYYDEICLELKNQFPLLYQDIDDIQHDQIIAYVYEGAIVTAGDNRGIGETKSVLLPADGENFFTDYAYLNDYENLNYTTYRQSILSPDMVYYDSLGRVLSPVNIKYAIYETPADMTKYVGVFDEATVKYINPRGACSWVEGSPESALEPLWIASKFHADNAALFGGDAESTMRKAVKDFYQTYLHVSLSDGQVSNILSGTYAD